MSASSPRSEKPIKTTGMWLFGGLTVLLTLGKVLGLWPWSWWHVVLPSMILLGFNGLYIAVGLLYLSVVSVPERPEAEETALVRGYTDRAHDWAGLVFVAGFGLNIVRRLAPAEVSTGGWLFSGQVEVLLACGAFAVISLWLYWSRIGSRLHQPEDRHVTDSLPEREPMRVVASQDPAGDHGDQDMKNHSRSSGESQ